MDLTDRMAGIDTNLDDLQAGLEASSRAADALQSDTTKFNGLLKAALRNAAGMDPAPSWLAFIQNLSNEA